MEESLGRAFKEQQRQLELSVSRLNLTPAVSTTDTQGGGGVTPTTLTDPAIVTRNLLAIARSGDLYNAFVQVRKWDGCGILSNRWSNV
jgi:hypothetical protein